MHRLGILILFASSLFAQKNEVGVYALGNFNPAYFATQSGTVFAGDNSAAHGWGASYSRGVSRHFSGTLLYGQNGTTAELYEGNNTFFTWPLQRYEISTLATQQATWRDGLTGFIFEGPGVIMTSSKPSGWSANFALVMGFGAEAPINKRVGIQFRMSYLDSQTGCYEDKACNQAGWSVAQDLWMGMTYRW